MSRFALPMFGSYYLTARMSAIADISCIPDASSAHYTHINETNAANIRKSSFNDTTVAAVKNSSGGDTRKSSVNETKKSFVEEMENSVRDIDITKPPSDLFLDGCKVLSFCA